MFGFCAKFWLWFCTAIWHESFLNQRHLTIVIWNFYKEKLFWCEKNMTECLWRYFPIDLPCYELAVYFSIFNNKLTLTNHENYLLISYRLSWIHCETLEPNWMFCNACAVYIRMIFKHTKLTSYLLRNVINEGFFLKLSTINCWKQDFFLYAFKII